LTIIGVARGIAFSALSGINPFLFYGVQDFLMAGARRPVEALVPIVAALFLVATGWLVALVIAPIFWLGRVVVHRVAVVKNFQAAEETQIVQAVWELQAWMNRLFFRVTNFFAVVYLVLYLFVFPIATLQPADSACSTVMRITLKSEAGAEDGKELVLDRRIIDTVEKFLFVQDPKSGRYEVLPMDPVQSVLRMSSSRLPTYCLLYE
jgi:hypothetical protein